MSDLPVLMYHSVGGPLPERLADLSVPPSLLDEQLAALRAEGYALLGLTDALVARDRGERVVALTFDDGYLDFLETAVPILARHRARATLYVPTRDLGGHASWLPDGRDLRLLDGAGVCEVASTGHEVGSHGAEHVPMDVLRPGVALSQLRESRYALEDLIGGAVRSFCYPHGYQSPRLRHDVRRAGYANACTIGHRTSRPGEDAYAVSRLLAGPQHRPEDLLDLLRRGRTAGAAPVIKRAATPTWRMVRRVADRALGVKLT
jgi:peptidoglycan/xylan/chitin deacetylase (PgdA/CDA1 family)